MRFPVRVDFIDRASAKKVPGEVQVASERDFVAWIRWRYQPGDSDRNWDWWNLFLECKASDGRYECYSARANEDLQGLLLLDLAPRKTPYGAAIVVDYLATNPGNRRPDVGLKYVGVALMAMAVLRSKEAGANGALWLEALPGACGFYDSLGLEQGPGRSAEGNFVYLLAPKRSEGLLEETRTRGIIES